MNKFVVVDEKPFTVVNTNYILKVSEIPDETERITSQFILTLTTGETFTIDREHYDFFLQAIDATIG